MAEPQITPILFEVLPTAPQATEQYAGIALTGLFTVHAGQINSERQTIWQRYNVMLGANSIVLAFLAFTGRTKGELLIGSLFGMALSVIWWVMTESGWRLLAMRIRTALQFQWTRLDPAANPFEVSLTYGRGAVGGMIYYMAIAVIILFILGYVLIVGLSLKP